MSKQSDIAKIDFIIEKIDDALAYKETFGSIEATLNSKMGFDAVSMCILQVGETLNKLSQEIIQKHTELPVKESYLTRNYIAHDYEGISKIILETILREHFPVLKQQLIEIKKELL